jgi:hypothetical protein
MGVQSKNRLNRKQVGTGQNVPGNYIGAGALIRAVLG